MCTHNAVVIVHGNSVHRRLCPLFGKLTWVGGGFKRGRYYKKCGHSLPYGGQNLQGDTVSAIEYIERGSVRFKNLLSFE